MMKSSVSFILDELEQKSIKIKAYIEVNQSQYKQFWVKALLHREKSIKNLMTSRQNSKKTNQLLNNFHFARNQTMYKKLRLN